MSSQSPLQEALDVCLDSLCEISHDDKNDVEAAVVKHQRVCSVLKNLALQSQQGIGVPTRVTAVKSLLHILNTYVSDVYVQFTTRRKDNSDNDRASAMSQSLQQSFRLLLSSLVPPSPACQASPLLRREVMLAIATLAKHINNAYLIPELCAVLELYQPYTDKPRQRSHKNKEFGKSEDKAREKEDTEPLTAFASFNKAASTDSSVLWDGNIGQTVNSEEVAAIAEIFQCILQKSGDRSWQENIQENGSDCDTLNCQMASDGVHATGLSSESTQSIGTTSRFANRFWERLVACAYVGGFEQASPLNAR